MAHKVAFLTAGGFAPCLSSAVGALIEKYSVVSPETEIIAYKHGYQGLLTGDYITVTDTIRRNASRLHLYGGSPIGNSRVKLTNAKNLVARGLCAEGENPLKKAADRLEADGVDILHTIGGDDTNTTAADLAAYLAEHGYGLTVVGLPKTVDNDIIPIRQSLGADTAADQGAHFAQNVIAEHNASARQLIIHEVMGRHCGWLTAATAQKYRAWLDQCEWLPEIGLSRDAWEVHGVYVPEMEIDIAAESVRLRQVMDKVGNVNLFLSEGAGVETIVQELEARGEEVLRDAFGHIRLETINPGAWFAKQFASMIGAEKVLVQKSGYFSRSAPANPYDLALIKEMADFAVDCALQGISGVIGNDEEDKNTLKAIAFTRIAGGKAFDTGEAWFQQLLDEIGQTHTH
ncbi:MAG: pyrophosphate--fructose-6-phosphate 1-phosphotransferase [Propionibacteriaceae bacterium]|jgi:pyrophosphate--fructose-6-phosphate 1-phosphotransferase|nr:pyrophosphate--fructose-6-phosphate 1-phosphotransferase [Propionibacteriaceae bacterium]